MNGERQYLHDKTVQKIGLINSMDVPLAICALQHQGLRVHGMYFLIHYKNRIQGLWWSRRLWTTPIFTLIPYGTEQHSQTLLNILGMLCH